MQTIAILGAAGRIGDAAARAFLKAGWRVHGIGRGAKVSAIAPGVEPVTADAYDGAALARACEGADVILHALNPTYDTWAETVVPLAKSVLGAAEATGATVLIPGNVYNFGTSMPVGASESTPFSADTEKADIRIRMEAMFEKAAHERGIRTIVLRAGDFFGGTKPESWLDLVILKDLKKNRFTWGGPYDRVHAFAYLPDLGEAFVKVAEKRDQMAPFETLHFGGYSVTGDQMHAAAERAVGRKLRKASMPWLVVRMIGLVNPVMREIVKMSYLWRQPHSLANGKFETLIGPEPHRPLKIALKEAIADLALDGKAPVPSRSSAAVLA